MSANNGSTNRPLAFAVACAYSYMNPASETLTCLSVSVQKFRLSRKIGLLGGTFIVTAVMCNWQPITVLVTGRVPLWAALTETSKSVHERARPVSTHINPDIVTQSVQESAEKVLSSFQIGSLMDLMRHRAMKFLLLGVVCSNARCVCVLRTYKEDCWTAG